MQNKRGEWVPAIPKPYYVGLFNMARCPCGKAFRTENMYRHHYAYMHIVMGELPL